MEVVPGLTVESDITFVGQGARIKGSIELDRLTRVHGEIQGDVFGAAGSYIIVGETGSILGNIECDEITIDGFVRGDIHATSRVSISESGRLIGNVNAPQFGVKFGAFFQGRAVSQPKEEAEQ